MDYYLIHVENCQNSKFDGQPYYELEIVGIDVATRTNGAFKTYVVATYQNYRFWEDILNMKQHNCAVWFTGDMKMKGVERGRQLINADSRPRYVDVVTLRNLRRYVLNLVANKIFSSKEKDFTPHAKQFFDV